MLVPELAFQEKIRFFMEFVLKFFSSVRFFVNSDGFLSLFRIKSKLILNKLDGAARMKINNNGSLQGSNHQPLHSQTCVLPLSHFISYMN